MSRAREQVSPLPSRLLDPRLLPPALLGGNSGALPKSAQRPGRDQPIILGEPGNCPDRSTIVHIVLDQSPSVVGDGGNDPLSRRHSETALAIRHVARACRCRRERVALVPFDCDSPGAVAPQRLTQRGLRTLDGALQRLAGNWGMSSQLGPALDRVETEAPGGSDLHAVVVFSDFLLTDANPNSVLQRLRAMPGYVHAVVLGAQLPGLLLANPAIAVTRLTHSSPQGEAARAVFDGLTRYRRLSSNPGSAALNHEINTSKGELSV